MNKLDETEADIARMNSKIEKVQEVIDSVEDEGVFHHKVSISPTLYERLFRM